MEINKETITWYESPIGWASRTKPANGKTFEERSVTWLTTMDHNTGVYTMSIKEPFGGPILSGTDLNELKSDFINAFDLCLAMKSMMSVGNPN